MMSLLRLKMQKLKEIQLTFLEKDALRMSMAVCIPQIDVQKGE